MSGFGKGTASSRADQARKNAALATEPKVVVSSLAGQKLELLFAQRYHAEPSLPDQR